MQPLWTVAEAVAATGGRPEGLSDGPLSSVSIDSREITHEALFVAIKGDKLDGHDYVKAALDAGASAALVSEAWYAAKRGEKLIVVPDPLEALGALGRAARLRSKALIVAVTGSAGKTTTKEAIRTVLTAAGQTHYSIKSFNNHWGVPLMLARLAREAQFGVFEIGMNHPGEIAPLTKLVRPHIAVVTTVAAAHLEFFKSITEIAEAKAEIFEGVEEGGTVVLNSDHEYLHVLFAKARERGIAKIVTYGYDEEADYRIAAPEVAGARTFTRVSRGDSAFDFNLQVRGRHMIANATAAFVVSQLAGVDRYAALRELAEFGAAEGRGQTLRLGPTDKPLLLVDESYNANVASMNAAMEVFAMVSPPGGKKVLVLGDMLELGEQGPALHQSLKNAVLATGATRVFLVGRTIESLSESLGEDLLAGSARRVEDLLQPILSGLAFGDAVMVKGSKGVRLALLIDAIKQRFGGVASGTERRSVMLYFLGQLGENVQAFNVFRYITFRTAGAVVTALFFVFLFGPGMIAGLRIWQGKGQPIREDGPQGHLLTKKGTPTMGGLMILAGAVISVLLWSNLSNVYVWAVLFVTIGFGAIGFYDDYLKVTRMSHKGFAGWQRLTIEAIIALIAGYFIAMVTDPTLANQLMFPFIKGSGVPLSYGFYIFAAFIIVGAGNSVNFTDGLDGLAIVPVMVAAACFGLIAYLVGSATFSEYLFINNVPGTAELSVVCGALIGAGLGFLWFNAPPAQIFMGDTGSLALGGALGTIAVATKHELVLAIIGGLFVLETVSVIVQVVSFKLTGKRVFKMAPIHHHFEMMGWTESQVVIRFWIISFVLALIGLSSLKLR